MATTLTSYAIAVSLLLALTLAFAPGVDAQTPSARGEKGRSRITLYASPGERGDARSFVDAETNLNAEGFSDRAMSVRVDAGAWLVCEFPNFKGHCETLTHSLDDLSRIAMGGRIASLRPTLEAGLAGGPGQDANGPLHPSPPDPSPHPQLSPDAPPPGAAIEPRPPRAGPPLGERASPDWASRGGDDDERRGDYGDDDANPDAVGHRSAYFIDPKWRGRALVVDADPSAPGAAQDRVDDFCRLKGYRAGGQFSLGHTPRAGAVVQDLLCVR